VVTAGAQEAAETEAVMVVETVEVRAVAMVVAVTVAAKVAATVAAAMEAARVAGRGTHRHQP